MSGSFGWGWTECVRSMAYPSGEVQPVVRYKWVVLWIQVQRSLLDNLGQNLATRTIQAEGNQERQSEGVRRPSWISEEAERRERSVTETTKGEKVRKARLGHSGMPAFSYTWCLPSSALVMKTAKQVKEIKRKK